MMQLILVITELNDGLSPVWVPSHTWTNVDLVSNLIQAYIFEIAHLQMACHQFGTKPLSESM